MYQTVGHQIISYYSECMGVPLIRREIKGKSLSTSSDYTRTSNDEVEDLFELLSEVKRQVPEVDAVATGAILSNYQRVRVENVCLRLGLTSLAYLWQMDQDALLQSMIDSEMNSILIKVASIGLNSSHLGKSIAEMQPKLRALSDQYSIIGLDQSAYSPTRL